MKLAKVVCACAILLITVVPVAQAEEVKVWNCITAATAGLNWRDGEWVTRPFKYVKYRVTQSGLNRFSISGLFPVDSSKWHDCPSDSFASDIITCNFRWQHFSLNTKTGTAVLSQVAGWIVGRPDTTSNYYNALFVTALKCETF